MGRRALLLLAPLVAAALVLLLKHDERSPRALPSGAGRPAERAEGSDQASLAPIAVPAAPWRLVIDVRDDSGTPTGASVLLSNEAGDLVERVDAAAGEEVGFEVPGTATVRVVGTGGVFAPTVVDGISASPGTEKRLEVRLNRGLAITGRVREPEGEPWRLRNGVIYAEPLDAPWNAIRGCGWEEDSWGDGRWLVFAVGLEDDGTFAVPGLPPGRYRLAAECGEQEYGPRDEAQVVEAGTTGLDIVLVRRACVKVRFVDGATRAPCTAALSWVLERESGEETHSGEGDTIRDIDLWLPPGTKAMLRVEAEGHVPHAPLPIVAGGSGERTDVVCELHPDPTIWADLEVALRDESEKPVTDMIIRRGPASVTGDDQGVYRLRVPAGTWYVEASPSSWYLLARDLNTFWLPVGAEVRLERGGFVRRELRVRRGALIVAQGDSDGEPRLPGTEYRFLARSGAERSHVALVAPGTYRVEAGRGRKRVAVEVEAREGQVAYATLPSAPP